MSDPGALTILSTPKAFTGIFATIQTNAITSWTMLRPRPEVILFGDDDGTSEICEQLGLRHVPDVATNEQGTPLLSDMFLRGQELASNSVVCWSNADVMFTSDLLVAANVVASTKDPLYVVGRRFDIDQDELLDFTDGWEKRLLDRAERDGEQKPANWIDWFMFPVGLFTELPSFAIGRPGYDPWLIWKAAALGATVVDASDFVHAIHQRHDYSHVGNRKTAFNGPEAKANAAIVDDWRHYHSILYARRRLDPGGDLVPATGLPYRLARPRSYLAHSLRFTRPLRQRMLGERATRKRATTT